MNSLSEFCLLTVILLNFFVLGSSRLGACIHAVALQGGMLALLPLLAHGPSGYGLLTATATFALKAFLIPWLLFGAIREVKIRREVEPFIGYVPSLFLGALATSGAFIFADRLPLIPAHSGTLFIPTALATLATGLLVTITRRKALTQVLGYLILENGIYIFGILLAQALPLVVEAGVLLDLLVGVFVMGIVINQINREFSGHSVERLDALRE